MKSHDMRPHTETRAGQGVAQRTFAYLCGSVPWPEISLSRFCSFMIMPVFAFRLGFAGEKPNFSGTWTLDKDKSFSNPAGLEQTMTITHDNDQIKLVGKQKTTRGGEIDLNESYTLDGKETEFAPTNPPNAKGKRKAYWLPNNRSFLVEDEITSDSPGGLVVQKIMRKWQLSPEGGVLTIDYYFDGPRGSFEGKRVFVKKEKTD